jgi:hypothetical protein
MSAKPRSWLRARWLRAVIALALASSAAFTLAVGVALADRTGPLRPIVSDLDQRIGYNNEVHYWLHTGLGKVLSVCPCTAGLSRDQYGRAAYHRPRPTPRPTGP